MARNQMETDGPDEFQTYESLFAFDDETLVTNITSILKDTTDLLDGHDSNPSKVSTNPEKQRTGKRTPQSTMEVVTNKAARFRYDTELSNRKIAKEELLAIKFLNILTEVYVRIHIIDPNYKKAHPYCLIGNNCQSGLYIEKFTPTEKNNYTLSCKATIKIPKRGEYEDELKNRKHAMEKHMGIFSEAMKEAEYWVKNKNIKECKCVSLFVEAFYKVEKQMFMLSDTTQSLLNAKEGKRFSIHTIRPFAHYCTGSRNQNEYMLIVLTADSFIPKGVEVEFRDNEGWCVKAERPNMIKNVLEVKIPPYKSLKIERPVKIQIYVKSDGKVDLETKHLDFMYKPDEKVVIDGKKRKLQDSSDIHVPAVDTVVSDASANTKLRVKSHLDKRRIKSSKSSASVTAPPPDTVAQLDGSLCDQNMSSAVHNPSNADFLENSLETPKPYFSAVVVPSNGSFTSSTQSGYMVTTSSQNSMLHETIAHTSNPQTHPVPVPSAHLPLPVPTPQINMPMQSLDNSVSVRSLQSQYSLSCPMATSTVTSPKPPPSPRSNIGNFKTVAIAGQWLLIDQFGKPVLVLGGQNNEVSAVQDITTMSSHENSPPGASPVY